jgi:hypothetical protein
LRGRGVVIAGFQVVSAQPMAVPSALSGIT